ncbi:carbohydrate ABC transporter permease [Haloarculaceae archaeon H-GB2-1]|nr:carbohydrate ABC transporter permease [Haloarculaceae archaeon H-GB1-1]MEA5408244.1 carbohydrate ABC transporter permease [Haloarculaceae archaeon H-GB2-1]
MSTKTNKSTADRLFEVDYYRVALYGTLVVMLAFFLAPIETGIVTSFKTQTAVAETLPFLPAGGEGFTLSKWNTAIDVLSRGLLNSLAFAVPATLLSGLLGSITAYGLTLVNWRGQVAVLTLFVAGIFIPYQAVLVPLSKFWGVYVQLGKSLGFFWATTGISKDYAALIELTVTHVAYGLPMCTILFRSYYKSMSTEMMEAARLDGATLRKIYQRIVFPLSKPMFAVVFIYQFTQIWNDLLFALILVSSSSSPAAPIVLILSGLGSSMEGTDFALRMAGAFTAAIPTLIVYILFGDKFAKGVAS